MSQLSDGGSFVLFSVRLLVDHPERVEVKEIQGSQITVIELYVHPSDVRRVIGRKGRIADALRELLVSIGGRSNRSYLFEIVEPVRRDEEPAEVVMR